MATFKEKWEDFLENHHNVDRVVSTLTYWLPPLNYITIHYAYFIVVTMLASLIFWGSSSDYNRVSYTDSLFMVTSAFTNTGLNTINISDITTWQQVLLWILMIIGSPIWVSLWTVFVRKSAFEKRFEAIVEAEKDMKKKRSDLRRAPALHTAMRVGHRRPKALTQDGTGLMKLKPRRTEDNSRPDPSELDHLPPSAMRRTSTVPLSQPSTFDREQTIVAADDQVPATPADHISIVLPTRTHSQEDDPRHSTSSSGSSSIDLEDFLFHWEKILGKHNVSHNGQFHGLSSEEREQIGGCEYRALKLLALTVPMYFILWQLLCAIALGAWMSQHAQYRSAKVDANPWWAGIFLSVSSFNNGGLALFDDSLVSFGKSYFVLIIVAVLILAGNTAYPILLRLIFWGTLKILNATTSSSEYGPWKETLQFILKYPRRVYTTMFPSQATWWLFALLIIINSIDWVCFEILNIGNNALEVFGVGQRIMDGWFQSISVRAAGLVVFPLSNLYIAMQVVYVIMMYISVYPVVITMRTSNVYEERSLGIYSDDSSSSLASEATTIADNPEPMNSTILPSATEPNKGQFLRRRKTSAVITGSVKRAMTFHGVGVQPPPKSGEEATSRVNFISQQIRGQLAHDLWWLVLAVLIIVLIETSNFMTDPVTFSVFNVLFEGVSAYGCVGLSIGFPNRDYSFSGGCKVGSKLVFCAVMLRGRHRGLPVAVDRAVRLPGEKMAREEEEDSRIRRTMTMYRRSMDR